MSNDLFILFFTIITCGFAAFLIFWTRNRAHQQIRDWAARNGYMLQHSEPRFWRVGPYFWRRSRSQMVYYVTVLDVSGMQRNAYLRLGSWFWGVLVEQIDVTWDDRY